ncbi:MAG: LamG domain-containing protein, partial [Phycisphaerae bacterium]
MSCRNRRIIFSTVLCVCAGVSPVVGGLTEYQAAVESHPLLIGYWKFDDGTANDSPAVASPHHGTLVGATAFEPGLGGGQALVLVNDPAAGQEATLGHVNFGVVPEFAFADDNTGTIEAWVKPAHTAPQSFVACRNGGPTRYSIHVEGGTYTNIYTGLSWTNTVPTAGQFAVGVWHHVAYVFTGTDVEMYIDGRLVPNRAGKFSLGTETGAPFQIGSVSPAGQERWRGSVDEVAVYSGPLTAAEILAHASQLAPSINPVPRTKTFFTPGDMGPFNLTINLAGAVGAAGTGTPLTLTYTAAAITVTAEDNTPIPSGGTVTVPEGAGSVIVKVSPTTPIAPNGVTMTTLTISGTGLLSGLAGFNIKVPPSVDMLEYQAAVRATPSLISYYTFDEDVGMTVKDVARPADPEELKHHGVLDGGVTELNIAPTAGTHPGGAALQLDGGGMAYFGAVPDFEFADGTGTIEAWIRTTNNDNNNRTIAANRDTNGTRYSLHANPNANTFGVWNGANFRTAGYTYDPNIWYHVAYVFDNGVVRIYVNGVFAGTLSSQPLGALTGLPFTIGHPLWSAYSNSTSERFIGQIDEVAIYGDALSESTILSHFLELQPVLTITPNRRFFTQGSDMGPVNVTIGLVGAAGVAGGTPITLTYDSAVISVTTSGDVPIPSGGTAIVAQGATNVVVKVSGVAPGMTNLTASGTNFLSATGQFAVRTPASPQLLAYQAAVLSESSLISYYTFDTEPDGAIDRAPAVPTPTHDGTYAGVVQLGPRAGAGGGAMEMTGTGHANFGAVSDFTFADGTGTVEAWIRPAWALDGGANDYVVAASRNANTRYSVHVGANRRYINSFTGFDVSWGRAVVPMFEDRWYHLAFVYDSPQVMRVYLDGVLYASESNVGYPIGPGGKHGLGSALDQTFQIGSSTESGQERFIGGLDEVALYEDPLTAEQVLAHFRTMALTLAPAKHQFILPGSGGPVAVTLSRPDGSTGDVPVTLTFDAAVIAVDAGGGALPSGSVVNIPNGQPGLNLAVSALGAGATTLRASSNGLVSADALFQVHTLVNGAIILVDDQFTDNPADVVADRLTALGINPGGPGEGFYAPVSSKTHGEIGTAWQVLESGGNYSRALISAKEADEFDFLTPEGVGVEWVITGAQVSTDQTGNLAQFPGGLTADCYHQLGVVSARRVNNGDVELYAVNGGGGIFISVFYDRAPGGGPGDLVVTGNVRAVNKTKAWFADVEDTPGLETLATFVLTNVASITPDNPLRASIRVRAGGWEIGFNESAGAVYTPLSSVPGVHVGPGNRLMGGWDAASLNDAAITDEFDDGAFVTAQLQNMGGGRGSGAIDQIKVCVGCRLAGECPHPFSDADEDGDTDGDDFGLWQRCFTGV